MSGRTRGRFSPWAAAPGIASGPRRPRMSQGAPRSCARRPSVPLTATLSLPHLPWETFGRSISRPGIRPRPSSSPIRRTHRSTNGNTRSSASSTRGLVISCVGWTVREETMAPRKQQKAGLRVLIAGESWVTHSIHQKGFDSFTTTEYVEAVEWLRAALEGGGIAVDYQPAHVAARSFPATPRALAGYNCVILSDIGANTLLLHPDTFVRSRPLPNRLAAIRDYVRAGGGLVMVGGYLSFQGIKAKARYQGTPIETALPVEIDGHDDRVEVPEGVEPQVVDGRHSIIKGIKGRWPVILGYNRVVPKSDAEIVVGVRLRYDAVVAED